MSTDAVSASALRSLEEYQRSVSSSSSGRLGVSTDDFLKLFIAQLANQDPMSGSSGSGSGTDYIAQLAQLTMMEQISALNDSFSTNQAYSMIGKYVYIGERTDSNLILGRVDGVINQRGVNYLMVGGETYNASKVYAVISPDLVSPASDDEVLKSADLIGKTVTASITKTDSEGKETTTTVSGKVEKILIKRGVIYFVVDEQEIQFDDITEITQATAETTTD
jgi:Flagellar hook capping protein